MAFSSYLLRCIITNYLIIFFNLAPAATATCSDQIFYRVYATCLDLPSLTASLFWTFFPDNQTLEMAFVAPPDNAIGWVAWGINPYQPDMIGTRALLAYRNSNGGMSAATFNITSLDVAPSGIDYPVSGLQAERNADGFIIFATLQLPDGMTSTNHVWQVGPRMNGDVPVPHPTAPENLAAVGTLDLMLGGAPARGITMASLFAVLVLYCVLLH